MSKISIPGLSLPAYDCPASAPSGNVGVDMNELEDTLRPDLWLVTLVVTTAPSDVYLWGRRAVGAGDDTPDAEWGLINDKYGALKLGKIATGLAVGTHHYFVTYLGVFGRVAGQKSAGTVSLIIQPIRHGL